MIDKLIKELKEKHGEDLDLENHHYFLFFKDGVFDVYLDHEEKELKVEAHFSDGIKIYHSSKNMSDLL